MISPLKFLVVIIKSKVIGFFISHFSLVDLESKGEKGGQRKKNSHTCRVKKLVGHMLDIFRPS